MVFYPRLRADIPAALLTLGGLAVLLSSGCGSDSGTQTAETGKYEVADSDGAPASRSVNIGPSGATGEPGESEPGAPAKPPTQPLQQRTDYTVPEGGPDELLKFINELGGRQPQAGQSQEQMMADFSQIHEARIKAADKVVASEEATPAQKKEAKEAKLQSMHMLVRVNAPNIEQRLRDFCQELRQGDDPEMARLGRIILFGMDVGEVAAESQEFGPVMDELRAILKEEELTEEVFGITRQTAMAMRSAGAEEQAQQAMQLVGEAFQDHKSEEVAALAQNLLEQVRIEKLDLQTKLGAVMENKEGAVEPLVASIKEMLEVKNPGATTLTIASMVAQNLEYTRHPDAAKQIYSLIEATYKDHPEKQLAQEAHETVRKGQLRMDLIGKPLLVDGKLLDGSDFDWSQYQGKVVLVDFWATWCGPCLQELPNIKKAYEKYHDQGFEVVGINLDEKREDLEAFLAKENLPWTTVLSLSDEGSARWFEKPMAVRCGVDAIPFVVLVNREGNVEALHVRGEQLEEHLQRMFGDAPEKGGDEEKVGQKPATPGSNAAAAQWRGAGQSFFLAVGADDSDAASAAGEKKNS